MAAIRESATKRETVVFSDNNSEELYKIICTKTGADGRTGGGKGVTGWMNLDRIEKEIDLWWEWWAPGKRRFG